MAGPFTTNCCTSTLPPTCLDATPNAASPLFAESLAGTPTTSTTCPSTFRLTSPNTCSTPFRPSPRLSTSPSTTSHRRPNASRSNRSRDTNSFAAVVVFSPSCTKLIGPEFIALSERERDLHYHRLHIIRYWTGTPSRHRQTNRLYRQIRIGAANRELSRSRGERFLSPGYSLVPRTLWLNSFSSSTLPAGAYLWYKARNGLW